MDIIDLVYCWCDGNDEEWIHRKNEYAKTQNIEIVANDKGRFVNNDELKFSLRSVELYAPWINKIYIITDKQIPEWLDTENKKVQIVDHTEIIPKEALPTYNSIAIEHCIKNIPNLSEKFLYSCDDMFFNAPVKPEFFYKDNKIILRHLRSSFIGKSSLYSYALKNAYDLIFNKYGVGYKYFPHHNIDSYLKSDIIACYNEFSEQIDKSIYAHFRSSNNIERTLYGFYTCAIGHGYYKKISKVDYWKPWYVRLFNKYNHRYAMDSHVANIICNNFVEKIVEFNPTLLCLNDGEGIEDFHRTKMRSYLEERFPQKSSFEK